MKTLLAAVVAVVALGCNQQPEDPCPPPTAPYACVLSALNANPTGCSITNSVTTDHGSALLTVNANGQSKTVGVYGGPGTPSYPSSHADTQTQHIFAIEGFLESYRPTTAQPYTPHSVAVVVYPASGSAHPTSTWPDSSVDLAATEAAECPYLQPKPACHTSVDGPLGIKTVRGPIGTSLLTQPGPQATVTQNGSAYLVLVWPLLPDVPPVTTHPVGGNPGTASIRVAYGNQIHEWPLMSENGVPTGA